MGPPSPVRSIRHCWASSLPATTPAWVHWSGLQAPPTNFMAPLPHAPVQTVFCSGRVRSTLHWLEPASRVPQADGSPNGARHSLLTANDQCQLGYRKTVGARGIPRTQLRGQCLLATSLAPSAHLRGTRPLLFAVWLDIPGMGRFSANPTLLLLNASTSVDQDHSTTLRPTVRRMDKQLRSSSAKGLPDTVYVSVRSDESTGHYRTPASNAVPLTDGWSADQSRIANLDIRHHFRRATPGRTLR